MTVNAMTAVTDEESEFGRTTTESRRARYANRRAVRVRLDVSEAVNLVSAATPEEPNSQPLSWKTIGRIEESLGQVERPGPASDRLKRVRS